MLDFRWLFVDDDAAETFRLKTITFYENKKWTVTPCETAMGVVCSRFQTSEERPDGTAHTELGYVFRIGHVVALVVGGEGPRVGTERIRDGLVMPFARRAATRIDGAFDAAADTTHR